MSSAPVTPYQPMARPAGDIDQLAAFIAGELDPALADLRERIVHAEHKSDLFETGLKAISLRTEVSRWLAEARRLIQRAYAEQLAAVYEGEDERVRTEGGSRLPVDVLRNRAKERVSLLQKAVDRLELAREDLESLQSLVQTGVRSIRDEEWRPQMGA